MSNSSRAGWSAAASSELIQLAVAYNDALNRCTQTGGANIDEVMDLFTEDATWDAVGVRKVVGVASTSLVGKGLDSGQLLGANGVTWSSAWASVAIRPSPNLGPSAGCGSSW